MGQRSCVQDSCHSWPECPERRSSRYTKAIYLGTVLIIMGSFLVLDWCFLLLEISADPFYVSFGKQSTNVMVDKADDHRHLFRTCYSPGTKSFNLCLHYSLKLFHGMVILAVLIFQMSKLRLTVWCLI